MKRKRQTHTRRKMNHKYEYDKSVGRCLNRQTKDARCYNNDEEVFKPHLLKEEKCNNSA